MSRLLHILFTLYASSLVACDIDGPVPECDYNVLIAYSYTTGSGNEIGDYVSSATDYLFDSAGKLADIRTYGKDGVTQTRIKLSPGHYSLIRWGNLSEKSTLYPPASDSTGCLLTHCQLLSNDPLHYSRTELEVPPVGIVRKKAYQTHAYLRLHITVKGIEGNSGDSYTMYLDGAPSGVYFRTDRTIHAHNDSIGIPRQNDSHPSTRRLEGCKMKKNGDIEGEFICNRLTSRSRPSFSLGLNDRAILTDVDLKHFFDTMLIDMDTNECQEFRLRITYENGKVYISFVSLGDWEEGGSFG